MAVKKFNTRIQLKNDTYANWHGHSDLVLLNGEFAWDSTIKNFKIGDGTSTYGTLPYVIGAAVLQDYTGLAVGDTPAVINNQMDLNTALANLQGQVSNALQSGVQSIGGSAGAITLGTHLSMDGQQLKTDATGTGTLATTGDITTAISSLDRTLVKTTQIGTADANGDVTITFNGAKQIDGFIESGDGTDSIKLKKVAFTGKAEDVSIADSGNNFNATTVEAALAELASTVKNDVVTSLTGDNWINTSASTGAVTLTHSAASNPNTAATATIGTGNTGASTTFNTVTYSFDNAGHVNGHTTTTNTIIFPSAADLGLSGAMHFKGSVAELPTPTTSDSYENGDVILVGNKEYVRSGKTDSTAGTWVELGDESSFAQKTVSITGTGVLSGGGTLESDRTITHNTSGVTAGTYATNASTTLTNGGTFNIPQVTVDTYGHITAASDVTLTLPTITVNNAKLKFSDGTTSYDIFTADAATDNTFTFGAGDNWIETTLDQSGLTIGHKGPGTDGANITAVTTPSALKVAYDAKGHITSSAALTAADVTATTGEYGGTTEVSTVQGALNNLVAAVAEGTNGNLITTNTTAQTPGSEAMSGDINLHKIAKTANPADLIQPTGDMIIFDCGSSTVNVSGESGAIAPNASTPNA